MTLDEALNQPLAPLRDDGFSARIVLELRRREERRLMALWAAVALALLPLLAFLPVTTALAMTMLAQVASSHIFASAAGAAVLLWALRPARARF